MTTTALKSRKMHAEAIVADHRIRRFAVWVSVIMILVGAFADSSLIHASGPRRSHPGETETGQASWYGADQGRQTASGEAFDPSALTAAHRHLPFGTLVRVTNELNGKSVDVRINDRGPWRHGRIVDLSSAAADVLDMKKQGTVPVTVLILKLGLPTHHANSGG